MRTILAYGLLALGIVFAAIRLQPPSPLLADADPAEFSAGRALADIREIARHPHPIGTAEHDRVRDYLFGRLAKMGLSPSLRPGQGISGDTPGRLVIAPVTNIAGILPGKDRSKPALLIMAHYDSVPNSPGAADNSAADATTLEVARALKVGAQPQRDVILLFPDGEEIGLLGAAAFFDHDPLARRVGSVINFDARGDSGLANMFETGPNNSAAIAAYASAVHRPAANSLARLIYRLMPNGTDFTIPLKRNLPGFNFAFIGDEAAYHTPLATPDHLNPGSLQHMGDQALASARIFANNPPPQAADGVYADVLGLFLIQYSFAVGWMLFVVAAGLAIAAVWRAHRDTVMRWGCGSAGALLLFAFPAQLLWTAGRALGTVDHVQRLSHCDYLQAGLAAVAIGAAALIVHAVEVGRGRLVVLAATVLLVVADQIAGFDMIGAGLGLAVAVLAVFAIRDGRHPAALWPAALLLLTVLSFAMQIFAPEGAFALVWPLLIAAAAALLRVSLPRGSWQGGIAAMIAAVLVTAFAATIGASFFVAVGVDIPLVLLLPLALILPVFLLVPGTQRLPLAAHGAVILAGVALFAFGRWAPATESRPKPSAVRYVADLDHAKAWRVAYYAPLDGWERAALQTDGGNPVFESLPWNAGQPLWWSMAKPAWVPPSALDIRRQGKRIMLVTTAGPGAYSAQLQVRPVHAVTQAKLNGAVVNLKFRAHEWNDIRIYAPGTQAITFDFEGAGHGKVEVRLFTTYLDWPKDAAPLPPMPKNRMAFGTSGGTQTVIERSQNW